MPVQPRSKVGDLCREQMQYARSMREAARLLLTADVGIYQGNSKLASLLIQAALIEGNLFSALNMSAQFDLTDHQYAGHPDEVRTAIDLHTLRQVEHGVHSLRHEFSRLPADLQDALLAELNLGLLPERYETADKFADQLLTTKMLAATMKEAMMPEVVLV